MPETLSYDEIADKFLQLRDSFKGVLVVFYSIEGFIPWLWCLPLPAGIIKEEVVSDPFIIRKEKCDFIVRQVILSNDSFIEFIRTLKNRTSTVTIERVEYNIPRGYTKSFENDVSVGSGQDTVQAKKYVGTGDSTQLGDYLKEFNHQLVSEELLRRKGVNGLEALISAYLPCNQLDCNDVGSIGIGTPEIIIYMPIYLKLLKKIVARTKVKVVVGNFGKFDVKRLNAEIVGPKLEPTKLELKDRGKLCEPFRLGTLILDSSPISFENETSFIDGSLRVNLYLDKNLVANDSLDIAATNIGNTLLQLYEFRARHRRGVAQAILLGRFLASSLQNYIYWTLLFFAALLTYFTFQALSQNSANVITLSPELAALATILLLFVNFKNGMDQKHQNSKEKAAKIAEKIIGFRGALEDLKRLMVRDLYVSVQIFKPLDAKIRECNTMFLSKDFSYIYHRLRGSFVIWKVIKLTKAMDESFMKCTESMGHMDIIDENLISKARDCNDVNTVISFSGSMYNDIVSQFEAMIKYLDKIINWLKTTYTI